MSIDLLNEIRRRGRRGAARCGSSPSTCRRLFVHPDAEVSIALVDVATMEQLHVQWMDEPGPTDVLSFPMDELRPGSPDRLTPAGLLGDVVLCPEVAREQAREAGHEPDDRAAPAHDARAAAPAGLRPRGARRARRDVRAAGQAAGGLRGARARRRRPRGLMFEIRPLRRRGAARRVRRLARRRDAALGVVSRAELQEAARSARRGRSMLSIADDLRSHVMTLQFGRIMCEMIAAVLITLAVDSLVVEWWITLLVAGGAMIVDLVRARRHQPSRRRPHPRARPAARIRRASSASGAC